MEYSSSFAAVADRSRSPEKVLSHGRRRGSGMTLRAVILTAAHEHHPLIGIPHCLHGRPSGPYEYSEASARTATLRPQRFRVQIYDLRRRSPTHRACCITTSRR